MSKKFKHTALNGSHLNISSPIIKQMLAGNCRDIFPELAGKKGALFSNTTLAGFIDEEARHDTFALSGNLRRSIRTYSSGEQKKALLSYLLKKKPFFLIVDNPFDALDEASVTKLKAQLCELSEHMPIIQVFKRQGDLLPFISHAKQIQGNKITYSGSITEYLEKHNVKTPQYFNNSIPKPLDTFEVNTQTLVGFTDVCVAYEHRTILDNINWTIKQGEFWQLTGPNGSGKTTLLTMINGDNPKAFGQDIVLFGKRKGSGENVWQIKKLIGYFTPSMMELFKHRHTAEQMVISGLADSIGLYRRATEAQLHLAHKWLRLIGVFSKKDHPFIELSQIEQRMVLVARAMIKHPPLLILDEPSTGLDDYSSHMLSSLINKMAGESTTAILYVSHRREPGLSPGLVYELTPTPKGSIGTAYKR